MEQKKGSITVEASIIIPTIIFILIGLILCFMLLYQKTLLVKTATSAAQQAAEIWIDSRKDITNGSWNQETESDSLYNCLFDNSFSYTTLINMESNGKKRWKDTGDNTQGRKLDKILKFIDKGLSKSLLKASITKVEVDYKNNILEGKIEATLTQQIKVPLGWIKAIFDGKDTMLITAKGTAIVAQPAEYIRNVDLALEYANRISNSESFGGIVDGLRSKFQKNK